MERLIGPLYAHGVAGADAEKVLGLFDGRVGLQGARRVAICRAPMISGRCPRPGHSVAALLHGFSTFDTATRIAGVIPQPGRIGPTPERCCGRRVTRPVSRCDTIPRTAELELTIIWVVPPIEVRHSSPCERGVSTYTSIWPR